MPNVLKTEVINALAQSNDLAFPADPAADEKSDRMDHKVQCLVPQSIVNNSDVIYGITDKETTPDVRPVAVGGQGLYMQFSDGREILDACGGAAVACLGHGSKEVIDAIIAQAVTISYVPWGFFDNQAKLDLSKWFLESSGGHFQKTYITCSGMCSPLNHPLYDARGRLCSTNTQLAGSEAVEGCMKLAREYFVWRGEPQRVNYIARKESYHGVTIGSLSLGGHVVRRAPFEDLLLSQVHHIPACNPYRQRLPGESDAAYVARKAAELESMFQQVGPGTVVAFIAEPVVGAALGCMLAVPGYLRAMKAVCERHGALLILDEVMCGMGRTGTTHAWEQEDGDVRPDLQAVGKGLAGGYQPVSALLVGPRIHHEMATRHRAFTHGHTYQDHPVGCAAALAVQGVIARDALLANVRTQGARLGRALRRRLRAHAHVGDIRGRGLFWAVELVRCRVTGRPFDPALQVAHRVHAAALAAPRGGGMAVYYGQGCAGGGRGDHVMVMPAYTVDEETVEAIVDKLAAAVHQVLGPEGGRLGS
jgi:adenosylmethionine-8-amino-7-oxononanoate aminotransferase